MPMSDRKAWRSSLGRSTISDSMAAQMATLGALRDLANSARRLEQRVVGEAVVADVAHVHGGLGGDEAQLRDQGLLFVAEVQAAHRLGLVELGDAFLQHGHQALRVLVAGTGGLGVAVQGFLGGLQVGQRQFGLDDFDVGDGVDLAGDVDHVGVFEAAHHVDDGVGFADVREELVAQALALAGAGHQAGDVDEFDGGRQDALGLDDLGQLVQGRGSGTSTTPTLGSMVQNG